MLHLQTRDGQTVFPYSLASHRAFFQWPGTLLVQFSLLGGGDVLTLRDISLIYLEARIYIYAYIYIQLNIDNIVLSWSLWIYQYNIWYICILICIYVYIFEIWKYCYFSCCESKYNIWYIYIYIFILIIKTTKCVSLQNEVVRKHMPVRPPF